MTEPTEGAMSFDQAVESLIPQAVETEEAEAPVETPEIEAEASPADEPAEEPEQPSEEEPEAEAEPEAVEPVEPPRYWSQEAKARFAELPPELQAVVLSQEGPREEAAAKAKQEAAEVRQKAEQDIAQVQRFAEALSERIPKWQAAFRSKWGDNPDWAAHAQQVGIEQMTLDKLEWEQDRQQLTEAQQAAEAAQMKARAAYIEAEEAKLAGSDLADRTKRAEVARYLLDTGKDDVTPERLGQISAFELTLAHKAMLWDRAQAALKQAPKKPVAPVKAAVKPAAAAAQTPQQRTASQVKHRFDQTKSIDDAVALLLAKKA